MKRQVIIILSLVLLVGITLGAYFFVRNSNEKKQQEAAEEAAALQLVQFNSNDINKIELQTPDGTFSAVLNENGVWELEQETDFKINIYFLNSVASSLCNLTASENIGLATEDIKKQYELDHPYVVTLSTDSDSRTLYTGKLTATSEYYYVMTDVSDDVFLVKSDYGDYLRPNRNSLKNIYVQTNQSSPIDRITLTYDNEVVYDLQKKEDNTWEMLEPMKTDFVNLVNISNLQTDIMQLIIDKFGDENVTESQYAEYGFDDPAYTFYFSQEDGTETTIYALDYDTDSTDFVECLQKETGQIFYCAANYIGLLQSTASDFLSSNIYNVAITEVSAVDVQMEGEELSMKIDQENEQYTVNDIDVDALGSDAVSALTLFYQSISNMTADTFYLTETIPDSEPEVSITYTLTDGSKEIITLLKKDDETYYALRNGEYSGFLVERSQFTTRTGILEMYNRLKKAIGLTD